MKKEKIWAWHVHHDVLAEPVWGSVRSRVKHIKRYKPKEEIAIRLSLLKPIKGALPPELTEADRVWSKANRTWLKARLVWDRADRVAERARRVGSEAFKTQERADKAWRDTYQSNLES